MDFSAFSGPAFWAALLSIIVANILLSGDNAVVIALASRNLPANQQKKAIFWGSAAAIILRVVLTITAVQLLSLPYLKIVGAILLVYIGVQLLADSDDEAEAARWCKDNMKKPVVGFIAGVTAPPGKRMGHAGALISGGADTADAKLAVMEECGFKVTKNPSEMAALLKAML